MRFIVALAMVVLVLGLDTSFDGAEGIVAGDTNCSGEVDSVDALAIMRSVATENADAGCIQAGDIDCDGDVDAVDALRVLRYLAGPGAAVPPGCPAIGTEVVAVVLNEVLFAPGGGEEPFAELKNAVQEEASLVGLRLVNERDQSVQFSASDGINPAGVFVRSFAGSDFLDDESGFVELRDASGKVLDRVAWGIEFGDSVNLGAGAMSRPLPDGASIGRPPGASRPLNRLEWVVFYDGATPGVANAEAETGVLLPVDGARFGPGSVPLNWYPVPGATGYRVRVYEASDPGTAVVDETVNAPGASTGVLPAGDYVWNVEATGEGGVPGAVSGSQSFSVDGSLPATATGSLLPASAGAEENLLAVELINAHKDTSMLLLESMFAFGDHAWDVAHPGLDMEDPADRLNSFQASAAMINGYFGGTMSQDRIAYEAFKDRYDGPLGDLSSGFMPTLPEAYGMLNFVFGGVTQLCATDSDLLWGFVVAAIEEDVPLIGFTGGDPLPALPIGPGPHIVEDGIPPEHVVVITGYGTAPGLGGADPVKVVAVNDALLAAPYGVAFFQADFTCLWKPQAVVIGAYDEPEVSADSDGDGVVDFDESMRFGTDPSVEDTDRDGLDDKQDIRQSVYGMGVSLGGAPPGRDWDGDGMPMELDCDGDNDGSLDGVDADNFSTPANPASAACEVIAWVGDTYAIMPVSPGSGETIEKFGRDLVFVLDDPEGVPKAWNLVSGTIEFVVSGTTSGGCPVEGSLLTTAPENEGYIWYLAGYDQYTGLGNPSSELNARVDVVQHCPDGDVHSTRIPGAWFLISNVFKTENPLVLEGENILPTGSYEWSFHAGSPLGGASSTVTDQGNESPSGRLQTRLQSIFDAP